MWTVQPRIPLAGVVLLFATTAVADEADRHLAGAGVVYPKVVDSEHPLDVTEYAEDSADEQASFACEEGVANWRSEWSKEKKKHCCSTQGVGCASEVDPLSCDELGWPDKTIEGCGNFNGGIGVPGVCGSAGDEDLKANGKCKAPGSFASANAFCRAKGARLCSELELLLNEAATPGCSLEDEFVWSGTSCEDGGHKAVKLGKCGKDPKSQCMTSDSVPYGRCCANVELNCSSKACSELDWSPIPKKDAGKLLALADMGICYSGNEYAPKLGTYKEAEQFCASKGVRLCTGHEMLNFEADVGTPDTEPAWSATVCPYGFMTVGMTSDGSAPKFQCIGSTENASIGRCCADMRFNGLAPRHCESGGVQIKTSSATAKTSSTAADGNSSIFDGEDCNVDYDDWEDKWSAHKKRICCDFMGRGCTSDTEPESQSSTSRDSLSSASSLGQSRSRRREPGSGKRPSRRSVRSPTPPPGPQLPMGETLFATCSGREEQFAQCDFKPCAAECVPQDCTWGDWQDWYKLGGCSGLCARHRGFAVMNNECGEPCHGPKIATIARPDCYEPGCKIGVVECTWEDWSAWSSCLFDTDQKTRTRQIKGFMTGVECDGDFQETVPCATANEGRANCTFADWEPWTECSATCGGGYHARKRRVAQPAANGGQPCAGVLRETNVCGDVPCGTDKDCQFSDWSAWVGCTPGSLAQRSRVRTVAAQATGTGKPCVDSLAETIGCPPPPKTPVPCQLSDWSQWSGCSVVCDGGMTYRERSVVAEPLNQGSCPTNTLREVAPCQTQPCNAGVKPTCVLRDWDPWSGCSAACGPGVRTRRRTLLTAAHGEVSAGAGDEKTAMFTLMGASVSGSTITYHNVGTIGDVPVDLVVKPAPGEQWHTTNPDLSTNTDGGIGRIAFQPGFASNMQFHFFKAGTTEPVLVPKMYMTVYDIDSLAPAAAQIFRIGSYTSFATPDIKTYTVEQGSGMVSFTSGAVGSPSDDPTDAETLTAAQEAKSATVAFENKLMIPVTVDLSNVDPGSADTTLLFSLQRVINDEELGLEENGGIGCVAPLKITEDCNDRECVVVDCVWGEWNEWSACTNVCDGGTKIRTRQIDVAPRFGGKLCDANLKSEVTPCNTKPCHKCVDGVWGQWSQWSQPSASCGSAFRSRHREVAVRANNCGKPVEGLQDDFEMYLDSPSCTLDLDCVLSEWGGWSDCSCSCYGVRERHRRIQREPSGNGAKCGAMMKWIEPCNPGGGVNATPPLGCGAPADRACVLSPWSPWGECSATCGGGEMSRERQIRSPGTGFKQCDAELHVTAPCNIQPCSGNATDCKWGIWSVWSTCTGCAKSRYRHRAIAQLPNKFGQFCGLGNTKEVANCPLNPACDPERFCTWSTWGDYTPCAQECGPQTQMRERHLMTVDTLSVGTVPFFTVKGDMTCDGRQISVQACPFKPCGPTCVKQDCVFAPWSDWTFTKISCHECTGNGLCERTRRVVTEGGCGGEACDGPIVSTKRCTHDLQPPSDCQLSAWDSWSHCGSSRTQAYRFRRVAVPADPGGDPCVGPTKETRPCRCHDCELREDECKFGAWSEWTPCPHMTCESATFAMTSRKRIIIQNATAGAKQCDGSLHMAKGCPMPNCPNMEVPCTFGAWGDWSTCKKTHTVVRTRTIEQEGSLGYQPCDGPLEQSKSCNYIVDCEVSSWTDWNQCDRKCGGGQQHRHRQVTQNPRFGGSPCPPSLQETQGCNMDSCITDENCEVGGWSEWTECTPGTGQTSRSRQFTHFATKFGVGCNESMQETKGCEESYKEDSTKSCGDLNWTDNIFEGCGAFNGGLGKEGVAGFSDIECKAPGAYEDARTFCQEKGARLCTENELFALEAAGTGCDLDLKYVWSATPCEAGHIAVSVGKCGEQPGTKCMADVASYGRCCADCNLAPSGDCVWGDWSEWSSCSCSCNGGQRTRDRSIKSYPRRGGKACDPKDKEEVAECNTQECEGPACVDATWDEWGEWQPCSASCEGGITWRSRRVAQEANECGKPVEGLSREFEICNAQVGCEPDQDCRFGDWNQWSVCSKSCAGTMERTRSIMSMGRRFGVFCEGPVRQSAPCNEDKSFVTMEASSMLAMKDWSNHDQYMNLHNIVQNNLGGAGPQKTGPEKMTFRNIALQDNRSLDLEITAESEYEENAFTVENGAVGSDGLLARINMKSESSTKFKMSFVYTGTRLPAKVGSLMLRFLDLDNWKNGGEEWLKVSGFQGDAQNAVIDKGIDVSGPTDSVYTFKSTAVGSQLNNPTSPMALTRQQLKSAVTLPFEDVSEVTFEFGNSDETDRSFLFGGKVCLGCGSEKYMQVVKPALCEEPELVVDCSLDVWSDWSACTVTCDGGQKTRSRKILSEPTVGGKPCSGVLAETQPCGDQACPALCQPVDCRWGDWGQWSACSRCAGQKRRYRYVEVTPSCGGQACPKVQTEETADCPRSCNWHYCSWDEWAPWSGCSATCGRGAVKHRSRLMSIRAHPAVPKAYSAKSCAELQWSDNIRKNVGKYDGSIGIPGVCGGVVKCLNETSYTAHKQTCEQAGARVCTEDEMLALESGGTGCGYDPVFVFTSTMCGGEMGSFKAVMLANNLSKCIAPSEKAFGGRCCADVNNTKPTVQTIQAYAQDRLHGNKADLEGSLERFSQKAHAKNRRSQELALAFICGGVSLVMVMYAVRLASRVVARHERRRLQGYAEVSRSSANRDVEEVAVE